MGKRLLDCLNRQITDRPPFWFLRQAGRYLPEYREIRSKAKDFLDMCYTPSYSVEVTLQPIRRFGMDAAIIFSDILIIPHAMGIDLRFEQGEGPVLNPIRSEEVLQSLIAKKERYLPCYEAIASVKAKLPSETAMIGFCGAPWTLACYIIEGRGSKNFEHVSQLAYRDPQFFSLLIDLLTEEVLSHSLAQIEAGAEVIMLFDSWAGLASNDLFSRYCVEPTRIITGKIKEKYNYIKIIGFPRQAGLRLFEYVEKTKVDALHIDQFTPLTELSCLSLPLQGNLDPMALVSDIQVIKEQLELNKNVMKSKPYIINLGHGVNQYTPPEHVEELSRLITG